MITKVTQDMLTTRKGNKDNIGAFWYHRRLSLRLHNGACQSDVRKLYAST